ncbi:MAG: site-specific integrase, partial [Bacilli bacterium]|nr:site-specific integrase [Bacilli bacterium]
MTSHKRTIRFWKYYKEWIETYKKRQVRRVTYSKYELAAKYLEENYPNLAIYELDRRKYQEILNKYGETHELATTRDFKRLLDKSLQDANYEGWIKRDPTFGIIVKSTVLNKKRKKFLEVDETDKLANYFLRNPGYYSYLFDFILRTGLRFSESLGVTLEDVDFKNHTVSINKTYNYKYNDGFAPTKNESSKRVLAIDEIAERDIKRASFGVMQDEPLFVAAWQIYCKTSNTYHGKEHEGKYPYPMYNSTCNSKLISICKRLKITPITLHGLRHTHGSYLLAKGMEEETIQRRLGHAKKATTDRIYLHLLKELKEKD